MLLKVIVQPVWVVEGDDRTLSEIEHPAVTIPASEWPTYSSERFPREVRDWEQRLNSQENPGVPE
jgi:hypothetical protein